AFAAEGASVMVSDINDAAGNETVAMIRAAGGTAEYRHTDVSDDEAVGALVAATVERFGGLHLAVNNAGFGPMPRPIEQMPVQDWKRTVDVTLAGMFYALRHEVTHMLANGGGAIVNTTSIAGLHATPMISPHAAAKAGVVALTKSVAAETADKGIRVNAVAPGATRTAAFESLSQEQFDGYVNAIPMKRMGESEDMAAAFSFLLSDDAAYITGVTLPVDGGMLLN
ncbi:MAG: SDR family oxidoreductase, partial [Streptomyces sp.]|nr:SDR family oxidoreductase [Streptomyces sp.]